MYQCSLYLGLIYLQRQLQGSPTMQIQLANSIQCSHISLNAPFCNKDWHILLAAVTKLCIVEYGSGVWWDFLTILFFLYLWECKYPQGIFFSLWSRPLRKAFINITSSLIGWDLAQSQIENGTCYLNTTSSNHLFYFQLTIIYMAKLRRLPHIRNNRNTPSKYNISFIRTIRSLRTDSSGIIT